MGLSVTDRALLDFERSWWTLPGVAAKGELIRAHLGMSPTRYYQRLGALLDEPAAHDYDPLTVKRLRRQREERRRARLEGRRADPRSR